MTRPLVQVAEVALGRQRSPQYEAGDHMTRYLRSANVADGALVLDDVKEMNFDPRDQAVFKLRRGDVLITEGSGSRATVGTSAVWLDDLPGTVCYQNTLLRVRPRHGLADGRYLAWWARHAHAAGLMANVAGGANILHLSAEELRRLPIPDRSLDDQRRIADFLDDQVARIDNIVAAREKQRTLIGENFEAIREREVHNGDFSHRQLGQLTFPQRPINYGVLMPGPRLDSGIPLVEAGDAMRGPIVFADLRRTDPSIEIEYSRSRLQSGDLVMAIRGSVGAVQRMPELAGSLANVTRDAARISVNDTVADPGWVRHSILTHRLQEWLRVRTGGSAVTGINIGDLRKLPIPLPSAAQQRRSSSLLDAWELEFRSALQILRDSIDSLGQLKRSLITAAVTGEFDISSADGSRVPV